MANTKSAVKRWHQSLKRRDRNRSTRTAARSAVRTVRELGATATPESSATALREAYSALDRAAAKGAIHSGKADRTKRRLAALIARA